jgi:hypothetical protein
VYILDPKKAFGLTDTQAKQFARRLAGTAARYDESWQDAKMLADGSIIEGRYSMTLAEAAEDDPDVIWALRLSWNEALDWAKAQGVETVGYRK